MWNHLTISMVPLEYTPVVFDWGPWCKTGCHTSASKRRAPRCAQLSHAFFSLLGCSHFPSLIHHLVGRGLEHVSVLKKNWGSSSSQLTNSYFFRFFQRGRAQPPSSHCPIISHLGWPPSPLCWLTRQAMVGARASALRHLKWAAADRYFQPGGPRSVERATLW